MSLRKSSKRRKGSNSEVLPKPNARRRRTPAPSMVGLAWLSRLIGRSDILILLFRVSYHAREYCQRVSSGTDFLWRLNGLILLLTEGGRAFELATPISDAPLPRDWMDAEI